MVSMAEELCFEEAMKRMEDIIRQLEGGELTLEASLERFEEGVWLYRYCVKKLEEIEGRVTVIMNGQEGEIKKFDLDMEGN